MKKIITLLAVTSMVCGVALANNHEKKAHPAKAAPAHGKKHDDHGKKAEKPADEAHGEAHGETHHE